MPEGWFCSLRYIGLEAHTTEGVIVVHLDLISILELVKKYSNGLEPHCGLIVTGSAKEFDDLINEQLHYGWRLESVPLFESEIGRGPLRSKVEITGGPEPQTCAIVLWQLLQKHLHQTASVHFRFQGSLKEVRELMGEQLPPGWRLQYQDADPFCVDKWLYSIKLVTPASVVVSQ
jgi:hypothetical protein